MKKTYIGIASLVIAGGIAGTVNGVKSVPKPAYVAPAVFKFPDPVQTPIKTPTPAPQLAPTTPVKQATIYPYIPPVTPPPKFYPAPVTPVYQPQPHVACKPDPNNAVTGKSDQECSIVYY